MQRQTENAIRNILNVHPVLFAYAIQQAESLLGEEIDDQTREEFEALIAEYAPEIAIAQEGDEITVSEIAFIARNGGLSFYYVNGSGETFSVPLMTPFQSSITLAHWREAKRTQAEMDLDWAQQEVELAGVEADALEDEISALEAEIEGIMSVTHDDVTHDEYWLGNVREKLAIKQRALRAARELAGIDEEDND